METRKGAYLEDIFMEKTFLWRKKCSVVAGTERSSKVNAGKKKKRAFVFNNQS